MKKTMVSFIIIMLLIVSQNVFGFTFRGIEIGKSLNEMPQCQMQKNLEKWSRDGYPKDKTPCWTTWSVKNEYGIESLPEIDINFYNCFVRTINGKIEHIEQYFHNSDADKFLTMLKTKYGKPLSVGTSIVQNKMGAKVEKKTVTWKIDGCEINFSNVFKEIDMGALIISSQKYKDFLKAKEDKTMKDAIDKL